MMGVTSGEGIAFRRTRVYLCV